MAHLPDGEYMISDIRWRRPEADALRSVWGFTTGTLFVQGGTTRLEARFTDQNLANRFSDLEEQGTPITLHVQCLGEDDVYILSGSSPTLERSGACYILRLRSKTRDVKRAEAAV